MNHHPSIFNVRPFELDDLNRILEIQIEAYTPELRESTESFLAKHQASPTTFWVAESENGLLGYLIALPCALGEPVALDSTQTISEGAPDVLHLHDLAVASQARGKGVAQALVKQFFDALASSSMHQASLVAVQGSGLFWSKQGFKEIPTDAATEAKLRTYGTQALYMTYSLAEKESKLDPPN